MFNNSFYVPTLAPITPSKVMTLNMDFIKKYVDSKMIKIPQTVLSWEVSKQCCLCIKIFSYFSFFLLYPIIMLCIIIVFPLFEFW